MTCLPIVERELRITSRRAGTYWMRFFTALAAMLVLLCILLDRNSRSPASVANDIFGITSMLIWCGCMFAGVFQTADCLRSEKREATMGFLFLTDLRGYDVVLGKLAANSLYCVYGLLSTIPVLAMPLLMGGVTHGEFCRMVLVLIVALFFSLGIGMAVSACTRENRQAIGVTMFILILLTGILPLLNGLINLLTGKSHSYSALLWPSLGYAASHSADAYCRSRAGPQEYWGSLLVALALGGGCLILAGVLLPRAWQEKNQPGPTKQGMGLWQFLRFGGTRYRERARLKLTKSPFAWLAGRDRLPQLGFWMLVAVALPVWLFFVRHAAAAVSARNMAWIQVPFFLSLGLALCLKGIVAMEAGRRLIEDRQSGALELLLVTPLSELEIISSQWHALKRQFLTSLLFVLALFGCLMWLAYGSHSLPHDGQVIFVIIFLGNMVVLFTDFFALGWVGMWNGLRARQHHRAVLITLAQILVLPWLLYVVLGVCGGFNSAGGARAFFIMWYLLGVMYDLIWGMRARNKLCEQFRVLASGAISRKSSLHTPTGLKPAVA